MKIALSFDLKHHRQKEVHNAAMQGIFAAGHELVKKPEADLVIAWGLPHHHAQLLADLSARGANMLVMDFPYWNRTTRTNLRFGHYKISLNGLHPTPYLARGRGKGNRYHLSGAPAIKPWRKTGDHVLLAAMGPKGASMYGYHHGQWDREAMTQLCLHSPWPVYFRPKPSDTRPEFPQGAQIANPMIPMARQLQSCAALVTHHGNAAIEALIEGVPVFCADGPATTMGLCDLTKIASPAYPDDRAEFLQQLSWWQWSYDEIKEGAPLRHLLQKGLLNG